MLREKNITSNHKKISDLILKHYFLHSGFRYILCFLFSANEPIKVLSTIIRLLAFFRLVLLLLPSSSSVDWVSPTFYYNMIQISNHHIQCQKKNLPQKWTVLQHYLKRNWKLHWQVKLLLNMIGHDGHFHFFT